MRLMRNLTYRLNISRCIENVRCGDSCHTLIQNAFVHLERNANTILGSSETHLDTITFSRQPLIGNGRKVQVSADDGGPLTVVERAGDRRQGRRDGMADSYLMRLCADESGKAPLRFVQ